MGNARNVNDLSKQICAGLGSGIMINLQMLEISF